MKVELSLRKRPAVLLRKRGFTVGQLLMYVSVQSSAPPPKMTFENMVKRDVTSLLFWPLSGFAARGLCLPPGLTRQENLQSDAGPVLTAQALSFKA